MNLDNVMFSMLPGVLTIKLSVSIKHRGYMIWKKHDSLLDVRFHFSAWKSVWKWEVTLLKTLHFSIFTFEKNPKMGLQLEFLLFIEMRLPSKLCFPCFSHCTVRNTFLLLLRISSPSCFTRHQQYNFTTGKKQQVGHTKSKHHSLSCLHHQSSSFLLIDTLLCLSLTFLFLFQCFCVVYLLMLDSSSFTFEIMIYLRKECRFFRSMFS